MATSLQKRIAASRKAWLTRKLMAKKRQDLTTNVPLSPLKVK